MILLSVLGLQSLESESHSQLFDLPLVLLENEVPPGSEEACEPQGTSRKTLRLQCNDRGRDVRGLRSARQRVDHESLEGCLGDPEDSFP